MKRRPKTIPTALSELTLDDRNANRGTRRGRRALADSLKVYGPGRSVLVDRNGTVIAGNKTVEQARALGLPVRVVATTGNELIAVRRDDLDLTRDPRARGLALADNRVGELDLDWDPAVLEQHRADGLNTAQLWTDAEWARLIGHAGALDPAADAVLEPRATTIRKGDLYGLGAHRLLCGDATDVADVTRVLDGRAPALMVTDPPYGVDYNPAWRHRAYPHQRTAVGRVANDTQADWTPAYRLFPGSVIYSWHASRMTVVVASALESAGFGVRSQIIWVKQHFALSRAHYHHRHEVCWYSVRTGTTPPWHGGRTQTTVWEVPNLNPHGGTRRREDVRTPHATQKPTALYEAPIRNHTQSGEAIYDPFVGSGTAVIAAETLGRVACVMDCDPRYVQVTLSRWEQYTGQRARRLGRARRAGERT